MLKGTRRYDGRYKEVQRGIKEGTQQYNESNKRKGKPFLALALVPNMTFDRSAAKVLGTPNLCADID